MHATFPPANGKPASKTKLMAAEATGFNYDGIPPQVASELKKWAAEIRELQTGAVAAMLRMGRLLQEARRTLRPNVYKAWLASEIMIGYSTAANYVLAAARFPELPADVASRFDPAALIELSRGRVSPVARETAVALASAGKTVTRSTAIALVDEARSPGEASQVELDSLYRLRASLRRVVEGWTGEQRDLARRVLEVVREVLAEADGDATDELEAAALALGVPMLN